MIAQPVVARSKRQAEPGPSWSAGLDLPMGCVVHESADATGQRPLASAPFVIFLSIGRSGEFCFSGLP